ncbi:MAG: single-stranded DNA-binding protein [Salinivirgaceae bacterium]|jgi:single-strand DNA-binding protein|nr:single-stranded DNA-binding protein [Salinivirgaceae bacterium]
MVNKVILVGNVGKDPEVRYLDSGVAVAQFSLATSETYKDKEGNKNTKTEWHNIVFWRGLAEIAEKYVKKGHPLYIEGKITTRSYDTPDGVKKYITEIVGNEMKMLGSKTSNEGRSTAPSAASAPSAQEQSSNEASEPLETDDLPF